MGHVVILILIKLMDHDCSHVLILVLIVLVIYEYITSISEYFFNIQVYSGKSKFICSYKMKLVKYKNNDEN